MDNLSIILQGMGKLLLNWGWVIPMGAVVTVWINHGIKGYKKS